MNDDKILDKFEEYSVDIVAKVESFNIVDSEDFVHAAKLLGDIDAFIEEVKDAYDDIVKHAYDSYKKAYDKREGVLSAWVKARKVMSSSMEDFIKSTDNEKPPGVKIRKTWKADVDDISAFVDYVVETGKYELLKIDTAAMNKLARKYKEELPNVVPGSVVFKSYTIKPE